MTWIAVSNSLGTARGRQRPGAKRPDNVIPHPGRTAVARLQAGLCQHQGGRDARLAGRVNSRERSINVVKIDRRKVADAPGPKGTSQAVSVGIGDTLPPCDRRIDRTHPRRVVQAELGKPDIAPVDPVSPGRKAARRSDAVVGKGGRRKRMSLCNGADTGLRQVRRRKSCPLPTGLHREMTGTTPRQTIDAASAASMISFNRRTVNVRPSGRVPASLNKEDSMKVHPDISVSASSRVPETWQAIEWRRVERNVRGMQVRIAKATREGDWRRVKALQRLLTRPFCGKALAVRRVTENQGRRTAGVDRELWQTPKAKRDAIDSLNRRGYRPSPLRRVRIPKGNGKTRMLGIPTMRDRAMQALYLLALAPAAESTADPNSYAFRIGRSTADAMARGFQLLSRSNSPKWVLDADIEGCFDHLDHAWLLTHVPMDRVLLRKWLKAGVVDLGRFHRTESGTPQGGIVSPTLANLALDGLETLLRERFGAAKSAAANRHKVNLVRYADDFVITGVSKELLANEVVPLVRTFLAERGIRLSDAKTRIVPIDRGFDFLGWNFRKYCGRLLIKPSKGSVKAFLRKAREIVRSHATSRQVNLIRRLNPFIRGWASYHRISVAKRTFASVDHQLFSALWRWAKRRHPKKGLRWIAGRYWSSHETRSWVFVDRFVNQLEWREGSAAPRRQGSDPTACQGEGGLLSVRSSLGCLRRGPPHPRLQARRQPSQATVCALPAAGRCVRPMSVSVKIICPTFDKKKCPASGTFCEASRGRRLRRAADRPG